MSSIATKTGDRGQTSLIGGARVSKASLRVEAYGAVDEVIAAIGLSRSIAAHQEAGGIAKTIQRELFAVSESLAHADGATPLDAALHEGLTAQIHRIETADGIVTDWTIPGDDAGGAAFDVARTTCRRAERAVIRLADSGQHVDPNVIIYLNRLADLLWLLGRLVERDGGVDTRLRQPRTAGPRWSKAWP
ncbi:MAG TPA: cob(I)yrinic acid a,c-diamide adenosyltransferase [Vicinamibacterales bacterium]|nr:cob(I)yrinic acid a,c-diamide adenosyltransferase [Vicinamibacterales bacterium]